MEIKERIPRQTQVQKEGGKKIEHRIFSMDAGI